MFRTATSVGMLKPIALIAGLAILLWSLGLPSLSFVEAANVTSYSDTISDSAPSAASDHNIEFTMPGSGPGVIGGDTIEITFPASFDLTGIGVEDIDLRVDGSNVVQSGNWTFANSDPTLIITLDGGFSIDNSSSTQILIGENADSGDGTPDTQIQNPASEGSYRISLVAGDDSGDTHVVILTAVTVSASVETVFNFTVDGVAAGGTVNGETITGTTGSTSIPFGTLEDGQASTSAQQLTVSTNAAAGYSVTVQTDGGLRSTTGAVIDNFANGGDATSPAVWTEPTGDVALPNTWGHWGVISDDDDIFAVAQTFIAASTTPREVMTHGGPVNGEGVGVGTTTVGYKVEITALQEAGDDYQTTLTYVATPTF